MTDWLLVISITLLLLSSHGLAYMYGRRSVLLEELRKNLRSVKTDEIEAFEIEINRD